MTELPPLPVCPHDFALQPSGQDPWCPMCQRALIAELRAELAAQPRPAPRSSGERDAAADLAACAAAAPLPWAVTGHDGESWVTFGERCAAGHFERDSTLLDAATAHFIALCRAALPYWIERAEDLRAEIERLKKQLEPADY